MIKELLYEKAVKNNETIKRPSKDGPTIFDFLKQICEKTNKFEYDKKIAPGYLLSLWLSHEEDFIDVVHKIAHLQFRLPDDAIYKYYMDQIPSGRKFIRYAKKNKSSLKREQEVEEIMIRYEVSKREALMIKNHIERLGKNEQRHNTKR